MKDLFTRFTEKYKVCPITGCWLWTGALTGRGYGYILNGVGRNEGAHRVAYQLYYGEIGDNHVLHTCDNPRCVNPDHLFLGSHQDNMDDMAQKGRRKSNPPKGSAHIHAKLTEDLVKQIRSKYIPRIYTLQNLADEFGVSKRKIYLIVTRQNWRHVA